MWEGLWLRHMNGASLGRHWRPGPGVPGGGVRGYRSRGVVEEMMGFQYCTVLYCIFKSKIHSNRLELSTSRLFRARGLARRQRYRYSDRVSVHATGAVLVHERYLTTRGSRNAACVRSGKMYCSSTHSLLYVTFPSSTVVRC